LTVIPSSAVAENKKIAVLPGDGIGKEVIPQAVKVIAATQAPVEFTYFDWGADRYLADGTTVPPDGFERLGRDFDAILVGAFGDPRVPSNIHAKEILLGMRFQMDLYANVRPVRLLDSSLCPLKGIEPKDVDFVVIRENTEDAYTGETSSITDGRVTPILITRRATERVVRYAFNLARRRKKQNKVTCVDKSNIIGAHRYFRDVFREIGQQEFPDLTLDYAYVDAFCQWQIRNPEWYDVVVGPNLVGDIISDNGATTAGGLGLAVGGNIGDDHAMFEPIHGSAPKHAGKDKANPLAAILAVQMMLDWLGQRHEDSRLAAAAKNVEDAVASLLSEGRTLTYDLIGEEQASRCSEVGAAVAARLTNHET